MSLLPESGRLTAELGVGRVVLRGAGHSHRGAIDDLARLVESRPTPSAQLIM
jgi:hypothetical protein